MSADSVLSSESAVGAVDFGALQDEVESKDL